MKCCGLLLLIFSALWGHSQERSGSLDAASERHRTFFQAFHNDSVLTLRNTRGYIPSLLSCLATQATFPLRMKGNDFLVAGGFVTLGSLAFLSDHAIEKNFRQIDNKRGITGTLSPQVTEFGNYYAYVSVGAFGAYSLLFHDYRAFRTSLVASRAMICTGLWVTVFKTLSGRMRPEATYADPQYNSDHWFGPFARFNREYNSVRGKAAFESFFSGHTGTAFALATVFSREYSELKGLPYILYTVAGMVGITRLIEHKHWSSDVFVGGVTGYFCGRQVFMQEKKLFPKYRRGTFIESGFYPFGNDRAIGLTWRGIF